MVGFLLVSELNRNRNNRLRGYWVWKTIKAWFKRMGAIIQGGSKLFGIPAPNAPGVTDLLAPPAPLGNTGVSATGSVTFTCSPTGDMHDGVTTPTGLPTGSGAYILNVNGVDQTAINAPNANIQTLPTLKNVGGVSPAPTATQNNRQWTVTSQGTGVDGISDKIAILGWEITGDFDLYVNLAAFSGAGADNYAPAGLMARETTAANVQTDVDANFLSIHGWLVGNNGGIEFKDRLVPGVGYTQRAFINGTANTRWFHLRKRRTASNDVFTGRYSFDGGPWQTLYTSPSLSGHSNTLFVGFWASDNKVSPSLVTAVADGLILIAGTQSDITSAAYTTSSVVTGKWKAQDANGNVSPYGPTTTASGAPVGTTIQWHVGHYLGIQASGGLLPFIGNASNRSSRQSVWNVVAGSSLWAGGKIIVPWGSIETALNTYDFSEIDTDIAYLKARNRKIQIEVWWMKFSANSTDYNYIPKYIYDGGYVYTNGAGTTIADINQAYVAGRLIALCQAFATRYDLDPTVEQFILTETSGVGCSQLGTIVDQVGAMWPQTSTVLYGSYFDTLTPAALITRMAAVKMGMGAPDIHGPNSSFGGEDFGSRALQGNAGVGTSGGVSNYQYQVGDGGSLTVGTTDYRGVIPVSYSYEALGGVSVASVIGYAINTIKCTHISWTYGEGGAAGTNYSDGILPQVTAISGAIGSSACPTTYAGACDAS